MLRLSLKVANVDNEIKPFMLNAFMPFCNFVLHTYKQNVIKIDASVKVR